MAYDVNKLAKLSAVQMLAEIVAKKYLDLDGVETLVEYLKNYIDEAGDDFLIEAKAYTDELAEGAVAENTELIAIINGDEDTDGSIAKAIADLKEEITDEIGDMEDLSTTAKSDLVSAINEVFTAIGTGGTEAVVSIERSDSDPDYAAVYTFTQGGNVIGSISVPKDMVVSSGTVEVNPRGQQEGTYLVLTIANATSDRVYINVGDLVDLYEAEEDATQIQLVVDNTTRIISASIVAGSVTATEIADSAITTAKIADGNVTTAKLSMEVRAELSAAASAIQSVTTGTTDGTISVDGTDVEVAGLGSAAFTDADDYDEAGAAAAVLGTEEDDEDALTIYGVKAYVESLATALEDSFVPITSEEIAALFE